VVDVGGGLVTVGLHPLGATAGRAVVRAVVVD
jgi:hypothetical protein